MFLKKFGYVVGKPTTVYASNFDETIRLGRSRCFLITGEHSSGSVAAFELIVPGAARLATA